MAGDLPGAAQDKKAVLGEKGYLARMNMYVSNLGFQVEDEDLKKRFEAYGEVSSAKVIRDRETGRSRGFGFVEMASEEQAGQAMSALNNKEFEGRAMSVSVAREREDRGSRNRW